MIDAAPYQSSPPRSAFDFTRVTERWDTPASRRQRQMAYLRYTFTATAASGSRYLDVACGTGLGISLAQDEARFAVGGDLMGANLTDARARLPSANLVRLRSEGLPFRDRSFDVLSCLEAIYYFSDPVAFFLEAKRVLGEAGRLVLSWPNPARPGFHPSPGAWRYPSVDEIRDWLGDAGFDSTAWGAFPWTGDSAGSPLLERARRIGVRLRLIPGSLAGRARLKRLVYWNMRPVSVLDASVDVDEALTALEPGTGTSPFTLFVCLARSRREQGAMRADSRLDS